MTTKNLEIQKKIDGIIDKVFLRFIPHTILPNQITVVRFLLIPVVYYLLASGNNSPGLIVFIIAACTDFIDGAMARTRNQITDLGKVIDPVADKLLILTVIAYIGLDYLIVKIFIVFIFVELVGILFSSMFSSATGWPIGANVFGKMKMILQSFGVGLFILGIIFGNELIINGAQYILYVALFFALISAIEIVRRRINDHLSKV